MSMQIKKAVRERVFLKLVVGGPSGGGKTFGAIGVAKGLAPNGKIGVIDSENRSASYYASKWDFDVIELEAPFTTQKYLEALRAFIDGGYEVVVIDSLTHEWAASGGILDQKSQKDARGGNSFTNWNEMKQLHNKFVEVLLQSKIHVVCTLRSKMEYALEQDDKGKSTVRKVGLAPISSDGMEYEFGVMFDVDRNSHLAIASKDRTGLFEGRSMNLDESIGQELRAWLETGAEMAPVPDPKAPAPIQPKPAPVTSAPKTEAARPTSTTTNAAASPSKTPAGPSVAAAGASPVAPSEPPPEWVAAMTDLLEATVGMPVMTRNKLVATWEAEGPTALPELLKEIAMLRATTTGAVIGALPPLEKTPVSQAASDFVESIDPGPAPDTDEGSGGISPEQYEALGMLLKAYAISRDSYRSYCFKAGHLLPGANGPTLARLKADEFAKMRDKLMNKKIAAGKETWSQRFVRIVNQTPITTYTPTTSAA